MARSAPHSPQHRFGEGVAQALRAGGIGLQHAGEDAWPLLQATAAASCAWLIARYGFQHPEPFFAPVAAVVALNTTVGERGLNTVRLLRGVFIGIAIGELTRYSLGRGPGTLAVGTFLAMAIARATGAARVALAQAAVSAILCIAVVTDAGLLRFVDALIGAGVALTFSQFLFSPEPIGLVRRGEAAALEQMARGLARAARALERDDEALRVDALRQRREQRDALAELSRLRRAGFAVAHHTLLWWSRRERVVEEEESALRLDLLGDSCLMLTRLTLTLPAPQRLAFAPMVGELSRVLTGLSEQPGDPGARRRAADRALAILRGPVSSSASATIGAAITAVRMTAADLIAFAGGAP